MMKVDVMSRKGGYYTTYSGNLRVSKNTRNDKWIIVKDFTDDEIKLYEKDPNWDGKDCMIAEYSTEDYYLILN